MPQKNQPISETTECVSTTNIPLTLDFAARGLAGRGETGAYSQKKNLI
ncbi:hypothetical protein [Geoalkalibacter sp.]|nr:hypothetical protein [Geoalkalibacter sp.]